MPLPTLAFQAASGSCVYYRQGHCARGAHCKYLHSTPGASGDEPHSKNVPIATSVLETHQSRSFCEFHTRGLCRFGESCRFLHPSSPATQPVSPSTANLGDVITHTFGICKFFAQGRCNKGTACPFPHVEDPVSDSVSCVRGKTDTANSVGRSLTAATHKRSVQPPQMSATSALSNHQQADPSFAKTSVLGHCKFFVQGRCSKGDTCSFWHPSASVVPRPDIGNDVPNIVSISTTLPGPVYERESDINHVALSTLKSPKPMLAKIHPDPESPQEDATYTTRSRLGCTITYGAGAAIHEIVTAFESRSVILHNLPTTTTQAQLISMAEPFGPLKCLVFTPARNDRSRPSALIEYLNISHAAEAVTELGKHAILRGVTSRLGLRAAESGKAILRSTKAKLSWFSPSLAAWAHYPSLTKAREQAARLDGMVFDGRTVKATFQVPSWNQKVSFSVELKGLPVDTSSTHLKRFCHAHSVTLGQPSFNVEDSVRELRSLLSVHGTLEVFDLVPLIQGKSKCVAFVQFADAESAERVVAALHMSRHSFIRGSQIFLERIHSIKYMLPFTQFAVLRAQIDELKDALQTVKLRYHDKTEDGRDADRVCVRAYGPDAKALGRVKTELEQMFKGDIVLDEDGNVAWHDTLGSASGNQLLESIAGQTKTHVQCDSRTRMIHLFGSLSGRMAAKAQVHATIEKLKAEEHIIDLDQNAFRGMLHGGFRALQESQPGRNVVFDVMRKRLFVRGDESDVRALRDCIALHQVGGIPLEYTPASADVATCPVCFCDVTDSLALACGHTYCRPCLQHYLISLGQSTGGGQTIGICLAEVTTDNGSQTSCRHKISLETIRSLLSPDEEERLLESAFLSYIHGRSQEFRYCPTADCPTVYRAQPDGTMLRCPACLARVCASCHIEFHEGLSCVEFKDNTGEGNEAFQKWRKEHGVKACPGCGADLEKNGGCNHMKCARCGVHMCWVCMKVFEEIDSGVGVYAHMRREHGDIF